MPANANLARLHEAGVSIWLDTRSRRLLDSGEFADLIRDCSVTGATSNPTIFAKAITSSDLYDEQLQHLDPADGHDTRETLRAFADHGEVAEALALDPAGAARALADVARAGFDLAAITDGLERRACGPFVTPTASSSPASRASLA